MKRDPAGAVRVAIEDLREEMRAEVERQLAPLRQAIEDLRGHAGEARDCLTPNEVIARYGFSRSAWQRWMADPSSGLEGLVIRPNGPGPGKKVLVPRAPFEAWLRARGRSGPEVASATG